MFKSIIQTLCILRNKVISKDDFTWKRYHNNYSKQIKESEKDNTLKLTDDFYIKDGQLKFSCNPSLNENHEILYKVIYDLNQKYILEVGCGGGDHMYNLSKIMPKIDIHGCDLLQKQLDFLDERNPELEGKTFVADITTSKAISKYELVYTQAVVMHIQKDYNHITALINLIQSSSKYLVLMENWSRHDFYNDIKNISSGLKEELYLYKVDDGEQVIMVISKEPIEDKKLNYTELKSNEEMLKYLK